jgi:hypothetical protein
MQSRTLHVVCLIVFSSLVLWAKGKKDPSVGVPLDLVIKQVQDAVNLYQQDLGKGKSALPPLSSAEFDFKTTTGDTTSGGFSILIFKFGASHEKDVVNDVTYTYQPSQPASCTSALESAEAPPSLKDDLSKAIQAAAKAVATSTIAVGLPLNKVAVNLQYGVKWDVNASGSPQVSFVTINLGKDVNKNTVQSVKLTYQECVPKPLN